MTGTVNIALLAALWGWLAAAEVPPLTGTLLWSSAGARHDVLGELATFGSVGMAQDAAPASAVLVGDACTPSSTLAQALPGKVAVVERGNCTFAAKYAAVAAAKAVAMVVLPSIAERYAAAGPSLFNASGAGQWQVPACDVQPSTCAAVGAAEVNAGLLLAGMPGHCPCESCGLVRPSSGSPRACCWADESVAMSGRTDSNDIPAVYVGMSSAQQVRAALAAGNAGSSWQVGQRTWAAPSRAQYVLWALAMLYIVALLVWAARGGPGASAQLRRSDGAAAPRGTDSDSATLPPLQCVHVLVAICAAGSVLVLLWLALKLGVPVVTLMVAIFGLSAGAACARVVARPAVVKLAPRTQAWAIACCWRPAGAARGRSGSEEVLLAVPLSDMGEPSTSAQHEAGDAGASAPHAVAWPRSLDWHGTGVDYKACTLRGTVCGVRVARAPEAARPVAQGACCRERRVWAGTPQGTWLVDISWLLACTATACVLLAWLAARAAHAGWWLQNLLAWPLMAHVLSTLRLPNLMSASLLLWGFFAYDIFAVFVTPWLTPDGSSVMVEVATAGSTPVSTQCACRYSPDATACQPSSLMPLLLAIPRWDDYRGSYALLGFGDLIVPGIAMMFVWRWAAQHYQQRASTRCVYKVLPVAGYALGLTAAFAAVQLMQLGQPALLYLVPGVLLPVYAYAAYRKDLAAMWA